MSTLPAENWDIASFDAATETDFDASDWAVTMPPMGTIDGDALKLADSASAGAVDNVAARTAAFEAKVLGSGFDDAMYIVCYLTIGGVTRGCYCILAAGGVYTSPDGTAIHFLTPSTSDFMSIYMVVNVDDATVMFFVDGELVEENYPMIDFGMDYGFEDSFVQSTPASDIWIRWIGVSTEEILPENPGADEGTPFSIGASGVEFTIDEFSHGPVVLTASQVLAHYKASKGLPA